MTTVSTIGLDPGFWGSVNTWECDENDHLNVRFYAHKINQAMQAWLVAQGADASLAARALPAIRTQHIRFLREARAATPLRVDCGLLARHAGALTLLSLMHNNATNEVLAAFQTRMEFDELPRVAAAATVSPPDFACPRGIDPATAGAAPDSLQDAVDGGYQIVGRGVIGVDECDAGGLALPHAYIGRVSDGMPNLWAFINSTEDRDARAAGELGGAALEYRLIIHEPLRAGDVYTHLSGIRALASKTQTMAHALINARTGRCAASATAVGVAMDLQTRKAVPISDHRRARLEQLLLKG
jgi:acyl-CoA thioester hydrolase